MPEPQSEFATAAERGRIGWARRPPLPLTDVPVVIRPSGPLPALRFFSRARAEIRKRRRARGRSAAGDG